MIIRKQVDFMWNDSMREKRKLITTERIKGGTTRDSFTVPKYHNGQLLLSRPVKATKQRAPLQYAERDSPGKSEARREEICTSKKNGSIPRINPDSREEEAPL